MRSAISDHLVTPREMHSMIILSSASVQGPCVAMEWKGMGRVMINDQSVDTRCTVCFGADLRVRTLTSPGCSTFCQRWRHCTSERTPPR